MITLLTDFGWRDHFAGVMKGVIARIAPRAPVVDITHDVEPYQIDQARFLLAQAWPYFPKGTVHVAVVDPGVGTARRPLLVEAAGHRFVGPDNGLFSDLLALRGARVRHITNEKLFLQEVSATFHGRDVFAPVAAHLVKGVAAAKVGPRIDDAARQTTGEPMKTGKRVWVGSVVHADRFGNLITSFRLADFPWVAERRFEMRIGFERLRELKENYASARPGEVIVLVGSSGMLEVAMNQEPAARKLGVGIGAPVELEIL